LATGLGQLTTRPSEPAVHTAREVLAWPAEGAALGVEVGLGAGLVGELGAAAAVDVPMPRTAAVIPQMIAHLETGNPRIRLMKTSLRKARVGEEPGEHE
jgi:hypothetical protein